MITKHIITQHINLDIDKHDLPPTVLQFTQLTQPHFTHTRHMIGYYIHTYILIKTPTHTFHTLLGYETHFSEVANTRNSIYNASLIIQACTKTISFSHTTINKMHLF